MPSSKKAYIELSPQVILTNSGAGFFIEEGHKFSTIKTSNGSEKYGVKLAKISPKSFQRILQIGYISRLEITRTEFTTVRTDLMDLTKLIIYTFLYRQFDLALFNLIIDSSMIREWNRSNPSNTIDEQTKINTAFLNKALREKSEELNEIKKLLCAPLREKIISDCSLQADEKNMMIFLQDRYLEYTRPFIWFLLMRFNTSSYFDELSHEIQKLLDLYVRRAKIADYSSLLLMELVISMETLNMTVFSKRTYGSNGDTNSFLYDLNKRKALLKAMAEANEDFTIGWIISKKSNSSPILHRKLEITIYNREAEYDELVDQVAENMNNTKEISLNQYYQKTDAENAQMGLHYLGYLQQECEKVGMRFTSRVDGGWSKVPSITICIQS